MPGPDAETIAEFFATIPLFSGWERSLIDKVVPHARSVVYAPKAVIVRAGDRAQGMGIVFRGSASMRAADGDGAAREMLGPGDHFGEEAMLLKTTQPVSVVAEDPSTILHLSVEIVDALAERVPAFARALAKKLSERMVQGGATSARRASNPSTPEVLGRVPSVPPPPFAKGAFGPSMPPASLPGGVIPFVQVSDFDPTPQVVAMVPSRLIQQNQLLPLRLRGNVLTVGMVHPRNALALTELRRVLTSIEVEVAAIAHDDFTQATMRLRLAAQEARRPSGAPGADAIVFEQQDAEREPERAVRVIGDEVVQMVSRIVMTGLEREVSDIHIEPDPTGVRVRYRVNGLLTDWSESVPAALGKGIAARLKVLAGLDITERRLPQDGRIGLRVGRRDVDLRISTLPSSRGETIVLRVLEAASVLRPLEHVFVEASTLAAARRALNRPYGAVVVAGPTGSGKTATLYAMLHERRRTRPDSNVLMVEDPVEYRLQGVTQVQVHHGIGLSFAKVLRSMLRQDPDVIMVGEVRDQETAVLAVEAAMTGHLLFTSIHANDALSVVQRLENLGCNRMHVAQALSLVLVQRLARRLCQGCVRLELAAPVLQESLVAHGLADARQTDLMLPRPAGCDACGHSGFAGRVAVIESLQVTDEIRAALMAGQPLGDVRKQALDGKLLITFQRFAAFLLARSVIGPSDALLTVAT